MAGGHKTICSECRFELWLPIAKLEVSWVGLYNDARFPGRSIVALERHYDHLDELPDTLRAAFWSDVARVGAALRTVMGVGRVNYAVLGNIDPHVHAHVIPRGTAKDINPRRPPWEDPAAPEELEEGVVQELVTRLAVALRQ